MSVAVATPSGLSVDGLGIVDVAVHYGPTCVKYRTGSENCAIVSSGSGIRVWVAAYPGNRLLASSEVTPGGDATFTQTLPFASAMYFSGRSHGRRYSGGWRMSPLRALGGQPIPLDVLLCPSGAWVVSILNVANSCSDPGTGVYASHPPTGAA